MTSVYAILCIPYLVFTQRYFFIFNDDSSAFGKTPASGAKPGTGVPRGVWKIGKTGTRHV